MYFRTSKLWKLCDSGQAWGGQPAMQNLTAGKRINTYNICLHISTYMNMYVSTLMKRFVAFHNLLKFVANCGLLHHVVELFWQLATLCGTLQNVAAFCETLQLFVKICSCLQKFMALCKNLKWAYLFNSILVTKFRNLHKSECQPIFCQCISIFICFSILKFEILVFRNWNLSAKLTSKINVNIVNQWVIKVGSNTFIWCTPSETITNSNHTPPTPSFHLPQSPSCTYHISSHLHHTPSHHHCQSIQVLHHCCC